jgi:lactate dehydrogenase-like 2-hydroxyacid dehydrogenase
MTEPVRPVALLTRRQRAEVESAFGERFTTITNANDSPFNADALRHALTIADVLVPTVTDQLTAAVIGAGSVRTKLIANVGVGFNHIDLAAARQAGIAVTNTPDVLTDDTADLTIALMLMAARRLGEAERLVRREEWRGLTPTFHLGRSLHGMMLGIVGYGRIGRAVATRAKALGMRVQWVGRHNADIGSDASERAASLDALLGTSDIVSLHAPATPEIMHLMDRARLAQMRAGSMLINTARGTLVDEAALVEALRSGHLFAAGLDVYEREPALHPGLLTLENVVLLPHLGSATVETRTAMGLRALANAQQWLAGEPMQDRVA